MQQINLRRLVIRDACPYRVAFVIVGLSILICQNLCAQENTGQHVVVPVGNSGFNPQSNQTISMSFGETRAVFTNSPPTLRVEKKGAKHDFKLPVDLVQVTAARLYREDRIVIVGMVNGDAWKAAVVDLKQGIVLDSFLCYSPSISPDGRYIAFIKFYPSHSISNAEDRFMVYDAALGPTQNRPSGIRSHPAVVGHVVYPVGASNLPGDNVDIGDRGVHQIASESFFWDQSSKKFIFADRFKQQYSAVLVQAKESEFTVLTAAIPASLICPPVPGTCFERLTNVNFPDQPSTSIELEFQGFNGTPARPSKVKLSSDDSTLSILP
jgi:hypothetical protein